MTEKKSRGPAPTKRSKSQGLLTKKILSSKTPRTPPSLLATPAGSGEKKAAGSPPPAPSRITPVPPKPSWMQKPTTQPAPQNVPSITLPASTSGPAPATTADPLATGKKAPKSRAGNTLFARPGPDDMVNVVDFGRNEGFLELQLKDGIPEEQIQLAAAALISVGMRRMTQTQLMDSIRGAVASFEQIKDLPDDAVAPLRLGNAHVALAMRQRVQLENTLNGLLFTSQIHGVPQPQLQALTEFFDANRPLAKYLSDAKVGFLFNSVTARNQGGGVFEDGNIHTLGKEGLEGRKWMQIMAHEAGHATFQRELLGRIGANMPGVLDGGTIASRRTELADMREAAAAEGGPDISDPSSRFHTRYQEIQQEFDAKGARAIWTQMSQDARDLYDAWGVLRANNGAELLGVDMGDGMRPPARQAYQAMEFKEFLAETFMQVATGELRAFYQGVMADPNKSDEVKEAWRTSVRVLEQHVAKNILGRDAIW